MIFTNLKFRLTTRVLIAKIYHGKEKEYLSHISKNTLHSPKIIQAKQEQES